MHAASYFLGSIIFRVDGNFPPTLRIIDPILTKLSELFRIKLKVDYFYCFFAKNVTCIIDVEYVNECLKKYLYSTL